METAKTIAPLALGIIMFGIGLGLTPSDFLRVINYTKNNNFLVLLKNKLRKLYDNFDNPLLW